MGTPVERRPALLAAISLALGIGLGTRGLPVAETAAGALLLLFLSYRASWRGAAVALFALGVVLGLSDGPDIPPAPPADWVAVAPYPATSGGRAAWGSAVVEGRRVVVDMGREAPPAGASAVAARGGRMEALGLPLGVGHEPFGAGWRAAGHDAVWRPAGVRWGDAPPPPPAKPPKAREAEWVASALVWGRHGRAGEPGAEEALRKSGLVHLVVASGLRTTFLFGVLSLLLSPLALPPWARGALALAGVLLLSLDVSGLAVTRALLMLAVAVSARMLSRPPDALNALGLAALVLLSANPRVVGHLSFQLSFAAAATAVLVGRALRDADLGRWAVAKAAGLMAVAIHFTLTPLLARTSTGPPFWGPLANLLGVPLGMAAGLAGGIHALFGGAPGTGIVDGVLARLFIGWAQAVASWPAPAVWVPIPPWSALLPALVALVLVGWAYRDRRAALGTALAVLAVGMVVRVPVPAPAASVLPLSAGVWLPAERAIVARGLPVPAEEGLVAWRGLRLVVVPASSVADWRQWARHAAPGATVEAAREGALGPWWLDPGLGTWRLTGPLQVEMAPPMGMGGRCPVVLATVRVCRSAGAGVVLSESGEVSGWSTPWGPWISTYR